MSCPAITNKGGKLSISRFPVACELTLPELALLDYAVVPGVGSIGDTGIEQEISSYSTVNAGISPQSKAAAVGRAWDVEMIESQSAARDVLEAASAVGNKDTYATRIEWPDGAVEFSIVQVSSPTYVKGAPSGVRIVRYTMIPSFIPIVTNSLPAPVLDAPMYYAPDTVMLDWSDLSTTEDGVHVYASYSAIDVNALPPPAATLAPDTVQYGYAFDASEALEERLYFRVAAAFNSGIVKVSNEESIGNPANVLYSGSPTWLFGGSEVGFANVLGLDTLFTDTSGTTPVTAYGDAIALATNLADDDPDMVQDDSGDEPIYARLPPSGLLNRLATGPGAGSSVIDSGWTLTRVTANIGADGILNEIVETTATGGHAIGALAVPVVQGETYTMFCIAKAGADSWAQFAPRPVGFPDGDWRNFNLTTGEIGENGAGVCDIQPVPGSWVAAYPELEDAYILMVQATADETTSTSGVMLFFTNNTDSSTIGTNYTGNTNSTLYCTRFMMALGAKDIDWYIENYQDVEAAYEVVKDGQTSVNVAYLDPLSGAWKWDADAGPVYMFIAGGKGCVFTDEINHVGGDLLVGPTTWPDGPTGAIEDTVGNGLVLAPIWRDTPFSDQEKRGLAAYAIASGTPDNSGVITPPSGLGVTLPFSITADPWFGGYTTDFDSDDYIVPSDVTYYLAPDGDDSNDGLSSGSPKKSIGVLLDTLNATPPTVGATLRLGAGWYHNSDTIAGKSIDFPCNMICEGGKAILAATQAPTWSKTSGQTNVWQTPISGTTQGVIDMAAVDEFGLYKRLAFISQSVPDYMDVLDATQGALVSMAGTLYVHTYDSREPDADIVVFSPSTSGYGWQQTSGQNLYMRGIHIWGWNQPVRLNTSGTLTYAAVDCSFCYSRSGQNGFESEDVMAATSTTFMIGCTAAYNSYDGFGYRGSQLAVEIGCTGVYNGWTHTNTNDNGSTAHGSVKIVRINGTYLKNADRNVHDVNSAKSWLVGCVIGDPTNTEVGPYDNANLLAGRTGETDATRTWVSGCTCTGGAVGDVGAYSNAIIVYDTWLGFENRDTGDNGSIEARDATNW